MRDFAAVLAVAATLALSGCSSSEPNSPVDPEEVEADDYVVPLVIFGIAAVVGVVLVVVLLARRRRRGNQPPREPAVPRRRDP